MNKKISISVSVLLAVLLIMLSLFSASAAVYVQDGKFKYRLYNDGTVALAGYTSSTVDDVTVPRYYDGNTVIGVSNFAFEGNSMVRTIDFMEAPDLSSIGMYAFKGCSSLESVLVPDSVNTVDVSAFRDCASLNTVEFYGNNNIVPVECFYNCSSLKNVRLSAYLKSIQSLAFAGCTSLEYLELIDTISYIAPNAFDGDDNLTLGVYTNSYAHQYAVDNNIPYTLLDAPKLGDVNGDGAIDVMDSLIIQKYAVEKVELTDEEFVRADVNHDNYVDVTDALLIQKHSVGKYVIV